MHGRLHIVIERYTPAGYALVFECTDHVKFTEELCRILRATAASIEAGEIPVGDEED